jgi:hypothetical protein
MLMSDAPQKELIDQQDSDQDERLALDAAAAIHRLIAERNALRGQAVAHARELTRLRHHITLIRDSYRRLTSVFVAQLQHIDSAVGTVVQEPNETAHPHTHPKEKWGAPGN